MKCNSYNLFFETIANKTRLQILELLQIKPRSVSEICSQLKQEQSKISHSLKCLSSCHFIDVQKNGKKRIYSLNKETIVPLMRLVDAHVKRYCCEECRVKKQEDY